MSTISIITPLYNSFHDELSALKFLRLSESLKDYYHEHIILNDGSTDNTHINIKNNINNEKIKYINCSDNKGILVRCLELIQICIFDISAN